MSLHLLSSRPHAAKRKLILLRRITKIGKNFINTFPRVDVLYMVSIIIIKLDYQFGDLFFALKHTVFN